jgi:hypothetical protein
MNDPKKVAKNAAIAKHVVSKQEPRNLPARPVEYGERVKICRLLAPIEKVKS